jgi:hypothetical protein
MRVVYMVYIESYFKDNTKHNPTSRFAEGGTSEQPQMERAGMSIKTERVRAGLR